MAIDAGSVVDVGGAPRELAARSGRFGGTWQLAAGQTLAAQDGTNKDLSGAGFTNGGTVTWQSSGGVGFISSTVTNQNLWNMQSDADLSYAGGNASSFVNDGSFRKSAGSGTTAVGTGVNFTNNGVLDAQTGTIDFAGGSTTFNAGTQFTGAGVNRVSGNASFVGAFSSANLVLAAGTFAGDSLTPAVMSGGVVEAVMEYWRRGWSPTVTVPPDAVSKA